MLQPQAIPINFAQSLNTKADPRQVPIGQFLSLQNSIFSVEGQLTKRNGYAQLTTLDDDSTHLTTFNGNLTALGTQFNAYATGTQSWINKGTFQPISLSVSAVGRSAINQTQCDSVMASNGFVCTVFTEVNAGASSYKYSIQDSVTGQNIVNSTVIPVTSGTVTGSPRCFVLGGYFIVVFTNVITATSHLQYIAISINHPTTVTVNADIVSAYVSATTLSWDGVVYGNKLYIAYNTTTGGQQIQVTYLSQSLAVASPQSFASSICTMMSMYVDSTGATPIIYAAFIDAAGPTGAVIAVDQNLNKVMTATSFAPAGTLKNVTCTAQNGICTVAWEVDAAYSYDATSKTNFLRKVTVTKPATVTTGTVGTTAVVVRSVGLASKAFLFDGTMYMLAAYDGKTSAIAAFQPTYFLINLSGQVISRFAYQNGGGYLTVGLPQAQVTDSTVHIAYLYKTLITPVNKSQGATAAAGIYAQTGINLAALTFGAETLYAAELGQNLNISSGVMFAYDGNTPNEQNFNLYPDMDLHLDGDGTSVAITASATGGLMTTQDYFYIAIYQWSDARGNIFRSAPSIPIPLDSASLTGGTNSAVINVPTARLTYKSGAKIILYRWSTAQQTYYQVTSISSPTLNNAAVDSVAFTDTQADSAIIGNEILYTTGGVLENTGGQACTDVTIFDTRIFAILAEDQNVLAYSKQVSQGTPVEMSLLQTIYVAPNAGTETDTGPMRCLFPMDDKLIIFKQNALFYINGKGPNILGTSNQYSEPIFIISTVGSINKKSIVLTPRGLMFKSDKGIWLLGRDLSTSYIGAPVEAFNQFDVNSANAIPETNEVRFTLSNGVTLMYDYYYNQWGTFYGVPAISSTVFQGLHTYVGPDGNVSQETPGLYLDNGNPVLMQFTTGWLNLVGLQGYQRAYSFYFLGEYFTPHKIACGIAYNYNPAIQQLTVIQPKNFSPNFGSGAENDPYGQINRFGGPDASEQWRVFLTKQRCQAFQISMQETYDPSYGIPAGQGFSMSGLNLSIGKKKGFRTISAAQSTGGQQ